MPKRTKDLEDFGEGKRPELPNRFQKFVGNTFYDIADWVNWRDIIPNPFASFFEWKKIHNPVLYYTEEFSSVLNPKNDFHFRQAEIQGVEPQDFAKIVLTVAHFVERAATNYPSNEEHRKRVRTEKPDLEQRHFRPVPFGEILRVLGSNTTDSECQPIFQGTTRNVNVGVLHIQIKTYPTTVLTDERDDEIPYDRRVRWFQELVYRCDEDFASSTYCFTPQALYSNLVWKVLVRDLKFAIDCIGRQISDCSSFNRSQVIECIEEQFDYEGQPYWCPAVHRDFPIL